MTENMVYIYIVRLVTVYIQGPSNFAQRIMILPYCIKNLLTGSVNVYCVIVYNVQEIFSQVLKMYTWETSFEKKVSEIRAQEMKYFMKIAIIIAFFSLFTFHGPFMVNIADSN